MKRSDLTEWKYEEIISECKSEDIFIEKDEVISFIDEIESELMEIKDLVDIKGIDDIGDISEAFDKIVELLKDVY